MCYFVSDHRTPWTSLAHSKEQYCLKWETKYLLELGKSLDYIVSFAMSMAVQETLKLTVLAGYLLRVLYEMGPG